MAGDQFAGDAGESLAREFGVPLLARIPFHPAPDTWDALATHPAIRNPQSAI
jgi:hypothetical protein